jgi:hypothetical protein
MAGRQSQNSAHDQRVFLFLGVVVFYNADHRKTILPVEGVGFLIGWSHFEIAVLCIFKSCVGQQGFQEERTETPALYLR